MSDGVDLGLIARQQKQLVDEVRLMREDMTVMMAILQRLDGTVSGLVNEFQAGYARYNRLESRVRVLED